jgi:hypothetical protein
MKKQRIKVWRAEVIIHDQPEESIDGRGFEPYITRKELREELIETVGNGTAGVTVAKCVIKLVGYKTPRGKRVKK